jgi:hypothetical protein
MGIQNSRNQKEDLHTIQSNLEVLIGKRRFIYADIRESENDVRITDVISRVSLIERVLVNNRFNKTQVKDYVNYMEYHIGSTSIRPSRGRIAKARLERELGLIQVKNLNEVLQLIENIDPPMEGDRGPGGGDGEGDIGKKGVYANFLKCFIGCIFFKTFFTFSIPTLQYQNSMMKKYYDNKKQSAMPPDDNPTRIRQTAGG